MIDSKTDELKIFQKRIENLNYFIEHNNNQFYIISNLKKNYKIFKTSSSNQKTEIENWIEVLPNGKEASFETIDDIDMFENYLVIYEKKNFNSKFQILNINTNEMKTIELPFEYSSILPGMNIEFKSKFSYFSYNSPLHSQKNCKINLTNGSFQEIVKKKKEENLEDFYKIERILVTSEIDKSVKIPLTLIYHKFLQKDFE